MGNTLIIARKEIGSLLNEKTLILAIIIQLLVASFSSLLIIGLASFFDPSALDRYDMDRAKIGIVGEGELDQFIRRSQVELSYYNTIDSALSDFNNNRIDAVLVIPPVGSGSSEIINIMLYLPDSDIRGTLVTLQLKKPLEEFETFVRDVRASKLGFKPVRLYVEDTPKKTSTLFEFIYGILIPLLVFIPVLISGGLIIDMLTEEYERKTIELLMVSPLSFLEILNGKMLTAVLIVPLQSFLWLMLVSMNRTEVHNIGIILLLVTITAVLIVLIGAIIAVKYKKRIISQYMYSLLLILLFLSGYLLADSPLNLVTRLSIGTAGAEVLLYCGLYAALAVPLYAYLARANSTLSGKDESAQVTIDYVAGMSIFLLTVAFVFQFMYGLFTPFQSGSDEVTLAADRAGAVLVERVLAADRAESMNMIDQGKLYYFNNTKLNYSNQTAYDNNISELGLFSDDATTIFDLNISIANLTYPDNPMNQSGPVLPENTDIGQTKRLVLIVNSSTGYNETAILSVRVW